VEKIVNDLKREHEVILAILDQVEEHGFHTDTGKAKFRSIKKYLLTHLKKEDDEFYPILNEAAKKDKTLLDSLEFFEKDTAELLAISERFFEKYGDGCNDEFYNEEFKEYYKRLKHRMRKEEVILFRMFENIRNNKL